MSNTNSNTNTTAGGWVGPGPGGSPVCAACRLQHKMCPPDCPLAPFFPQHNPQAFVNVDKFFGVNKIMKVLKDVRPSEQGSAMAAMIEDADRRAMAAMIEDANRRANDPIGGSHRRIRELERQIEHENAELQATLQYLKICRAQQAQDSSQEHDTQNPNVGLNPKTLQEIDDPLRSACVATFQDCYNKVDMRTPFASTVVDGSEEAIKPHLGFFDEKQPTPFEFVFKDSTESRDKTVLRAEVDSVYQEQDHDLKDAASLFSLANKNDQSM